MSKLAIRNLYYTNANHQVAIKDLKLEIKEGELVAIVGLPECGKSVLLRIIAGLEKSSEGAIWLDEQLINEIDAKSRRIATVFKNYTLYPEMTVYDNLAFGLKLMKYHPDEIKQKVEECVEKFKLETILKKLPSELNPTEYFVVVIVRALIKEPKLLLLDEPLTQIPLEYRPETLKAFQKVQKLSGVTTVYASGRAKEAFMIADRVAVMKEGELLQIGTPEEIYNKPISMSVAGAMMRPIMSFMEVLVKEKDSKLQVEVFGKSYVIDSEKEKIIREKNYVGKKLILGIRASDLEAVPIENVKENERTCIVEVKRIKEYYGNNYLYFDYEGAAMVAYPLDGMKIAVEDKIVIYYKNKGLLLFNKDSGEAILSEE